MATLPVPAIRDACTLNSPSTAHITHTSCERRHDFAFPAKRSSPRYLIPTPALLRDTTTTFVTGWQNDFVEPRYRPRLTIASVQRLVAKSVRSCARFKT